MSVCSLRAALALTVPAVAAILPAAPAAARARLDPGFATGGVLFDRGILGGLGDDGVYFQAVRALPDGALVLLAQYRCAMGCRGFETLRTTAAGVPDGAAGQPGRPPGTALLPSGEDFGTLETGALVRADGAVVMTHFPIALSGDVGPPLLRVVVPGGEGTVEVPLAQPFSPRAVLPDGGLGGLSDRKVMRLGPDMAPDPAFGAAGAAPVPAALRTVAGLGAGARGGIRVGGSDGHGLVLAVMNARGRLVRVSHLRVPGWGALGSWGQVAQVAVRADGAAVVVAGFSGVNVPRTGLGVIGVFRPDGRPDPRFGAGGLVRVAAGSPAVALAPGGRLVVAGAQAGPRGDEHLRLVVRRLLPDGRTDRAFGVVSVPTPATQFIGIGADVDARGRVVVAGGAFTTYGSSGALALRLLPS